MALYVGSKKGLFILEDNKVRNVAFLGDPVSMVLPRGSEVYAALNLGHFGVKLHRSSDGGRTWQEVATPAYPPQPEEAKTPWKLVQVWSLEGDEQGLWAGTIPGGLFRSTDRGESWALVESLWRRPEREEWFGGGYDQPGVHSVCIDPRDSRRVTIAVSCGGVWQTFDDGKSWASATRGMRAAYMPPERADDPNVQDPHYLVQCRGRPEVFWTQHHNGIFRSVDGAQSWREVTANAPSRFGFAVAVHPTNADTAWFVPAVKDECRVPVDGALCVLRTRDGGESFEALREGLPQSHCYDLVYRHGLALDESGERLAFGSTTGALWRSDDQGDSWRCVSAHLPPIHCVRFG